MTTEVSKPQFERKNIKLPKAIMDYYRERSAELGVDMQALMIMDLQRVVDEHQKK